MLPLAAALLGALLLAGGAAPGTEAGGADRPALKKVVAALPFEEAELILIAEAQRHNLNLVNVLDVKKGMENRGSTFRKFKIYQFCNLELGIQIYADAPEYGAFQLCSVLLYEVDAGRTALAASRQSWILQALPDHRPGPAARAAARQFERIVDEIFAAVEEEARARQR
jgi:uncharacterized protein (DUF302 family)